MPLFAGSTMRHWQLGGDFDTLIPPLEILMKLIFAACLLCLAPTAFAQHTPGVDPTVLPQAREASVPGWIPPAPPAPPATPPAAPRAAPLPAPPPRPVVLLGCW